MKQNRSNFTLQAHYNTWIFSSTQCDINKILVFCADEAIIHNWLSSPFTKKHFPIACFANSACYGSEFILGYLITKDSIRRGDKLHHQLNCLFKRYITMQHASQQHSIWNGNLYSVFIIIFNKYFIANPGYWDMVLTRK